MKNEWIYRELLYQRLENNQYQFTQLALAKKLKISLSTVNHALKPLELMGAILKTPMGFKLIEPKKLLLLWASKRKLKKQIVYQTRVDMPIIELERNMPPQTYYTAYSGYRLKFEDAPADYSEVYIYAEEEALIEIKKRFPEKEGPIETNVSMDHKSRRRFIGPPNLIILKADEHLKETTQMGICSTANIFVDLWNIGSWYSKEYLKALEKRIDEMIG